MWIDNSDLSDIHRQLDSSWDFIKNLTYDPKTHLFGVFPEAAGSQSRWKKSSSTDSQQGTSGHMLEFFSMNHIQARHSVHVTAAAQSSGKREASDWVGLLHRLLTGHAVTLVGRKHPISQEAETKAGERLLLIIQPQFSAYRLRHRIFLATTQALRGAAIWFIYFFSLFPLGMPRRALYTAFLQTSKGKRLLLLLPQFFRISTAEAKSGSDGCPPTLRFSSLLFFHSWHLVFSFAFWSQWWVWIAELIRSATALKHYLSLVKALLVKEKQFSRLHRIRRLLCVRHTFLHTIVTVVCRLHRNPWKGIEALQCRSLNTPWIESSTLVFILYP